MRKLGERIYADYFAGTRLNEYKALIESSLQSDFEHWTIADLHHTIAAGEIAPRAKIFVHRHDIDTDPGGARAFFEIEKSLGVKSTYYFRLSTVDIRLMREIHEYGSEVGYHYEELAAYAKRSGLDTAASALARLDSIRADFEENFRSLERSLGFKIRSVASHGDFINRRIGVPNTPVLQDTNLRSRLGIECESYDRSLMDFFDSYISDDLPTRSFKRGSPIEAIRLKQNICLLTHPRHWRTNAIENTSANIRRVCDELEWQWKLAFTRSRRRSA